MRQSASERPPCTSFPSEQQRARVGEGGGGGSRVCREPRGLLRRADEGIQAAGEPATAGCGDTWTWGTERATSGPSPRHKASSQAAQNAHLSTHLNTRDEQWRSTASHGHERLNPRLKEAEETQTPTVPVFSGQRWGVKRINRDHEPVCLPYHRAQQQPGAPAQTMSPETPRILSDLIALVSGGERGAAV